MTKKIRYERLLELNKQEKELAKKIDDMQTMIDAVDKGRDRLDHGLSDLLYSAEEMKGQIKILKERQKYLIHEQDVIKKGIEKQGKTTLPGDSQ